MSRVILHCDCNSFYASVETLDRPHLKEVPMAVAGDPQNRHGIILAKNEAAKKYGIRTAETVREARAKCPDLVLVPPHHEKYLEISRKINQIYLDYTDLVEPFSIDESFLDLTGSMHLFPTMTPNMLADTIRARVRQEIGITISVGVSFCRVFAKLGSDYKKPDATTLMDEAHYKALAYPLPVTDLLFVGKKTGELLRRLGVLTIGDLAAADRLALRKVLGEAGETLSRYARGEDREPVRSYYDAPPPKSVGNGMTFRHDIVGKDEILAGVSTLADSVAARLREAGLKCAVVQVQVKDPNFRTVQRQCTLKNPTWLQQEIVARAMDLIGNSTGFSAPIRMLTVTAAGLMDAEETGEQLDMFSMGKESEKQEQVEETLHEIRRRFGRNSIRLGYFKKEKEAEAGEEKEEKGR